MQTIRLITTDRSLPGWRSLGSKLREIRLSLSTIKGSNFRILVVYQEITPEVVNGRITHRWMDGLRATLAKPDQVDFVAFHMSNAQRKAWGIQPSLRGAYQVDDDLVHEFYFWADENTRREGYNQFVQTFLHEFRHGFMRGCGLPDDTHEQHADGDIRDAFRVLSMEAYNPRARLIERRETLIEKLNRLIMPTKPTTIFHPVQFVPRIVSQKYGVSSSRYPRTRRHIGTDYPLPVGTPLYAPWDGEVTTVGTHKDLGFFLHYTYEKDGQVWEERWCHLRAMPTTGRFKRGAVVTYSGNTGMSTGPHLHREVWRNDVRVDLITKANWSQMTVDPELIN